MQQSCQKAFLQDRHLNTHAFSCEQYTRVPSPCSVQIFVGEILEICEFTRAKTFLSLMFLIPAVSAMGHIPLPDATQYQRHA
jgi:hypothetical protein